MRIVERERFILASRLKSKNPFLFFMYKTIIFYDISYFLL